MRIRKSKSLVVPAKTSSVFHAIFVVQPTDDILDSDPATGCDL